MPCYYDTPDESNQIEIEKRAKVRMYFHATAILTPEQIYNNFICIAPLPDENTGLCTLCKILTEEQMKEISAYYWDIKWPHKTLFDWYMKHLEDDRTHDTMDRC